MNWNSQLENVIADEGDKCISYMWLHDRAQKKYNRLDIFVNVPVIVLSTICGAGSIGSDTIFKGFSQATYIIGLLSLIVGVLNTLGSYFQWSRRTEGHRIASLQYFKIYSFIKIELSLPRESRTQPGDFIKMIRESLERLKEVSPQIPDDVIEKYKVAFKSYVDVSKPEICNGLDKIEIFSEVIESKRNSVALQISEPIGDIPPSEDIKNKSLTSRPWK